MVKFSDSEICKSFVHKEKAKVIKYIEAMYNKNSKLNNIQNLKDRKLEACKESKLNPKDVDTIDVMEMKNEDVRKLVMYYLSIFQNSNQFHQLITDQQLFWSIQEIIVKPIEDVDEDSIMEKYKKRTALSETADNLAKRINRLYSEIYATDELKDEAKEFVRHIHRLLML